MRMDVNVLPNWLGFDTTVGDKRYIMSLKKHQYFEQIGLVNLDYTYSQHQIYRHIFI